jgi:hypothetical protein
MGLGSGAPATTADQLHRVTARSSANQEIPGIFQLLLALYMLLTGDVPTIIQAVSFGLPGGAGTAFAFAMGTSLVRTLLVLAAVVALSKHPLGILHPLLLAVAIWPLLAGLPSTIEQYGGWLGVMTGEPVQTPSYVGLHAFDASTVWTAEAKYNIVLTVALVATYAGFWLFSGNRSYTRRPVVALNQVALRGVLVGLFIFSMIVLLVFIWFRGGLIEHLTALGRGRFRELAGLGVVVVAVELAATAMLVWVAARPGDIKSPIFLACMATTTVSQFLKDGSRGSALSFLVLVGIVWALRRRKVPWKVPLLLAPLMFMSLGLLGAVRTASWSGSTAAEAWSGTTWQQSLQLAEEEVTLRRSISANVPVVSRGFDVSGGALLGKTYIAAVTAWIPRAVWPDKPRGTGSLYAQMFYGASKEGLGIPVSPQAEMYWNFGWPGVLLLSLLYGAILHAAYMFFLRRYPDPFAIVFMILFATQFQLSSDRLVQVQQDMGLLLICYVAVNFFVRREAPPPERAYRPAFVRRPAGLAVAGLNRGR